MHLLHEAQEHSGSFVELFTHLCIMYEALHTPRQSFNYSGSGEQCVVVGRDLGKASAPLILISLHYIVPRHWL